jgi:small subunit ribosomal protein S13
MVRIGGIDLPNNKKIEVALTYIFGIGLPTSQKILTKTNVDPNIRTKNLTDKDVSLLREVIENEYTIEGDLRRVKSLSIKRLIEINSFRGRRHIQGLPVRGQRTRTNAQTRKKNQTGFSIKKNK